MAFVSSISLNQAIQLGYDYFQFQLTDWGDRGVAGGEININSGALPTGEIGVALSPNSDVPEFRLEWRPNPQTQSQIGPPQPLDTRPGNDQILVTKDRAFMGRVSGDLRIRPVQDDTFFDQYTKIDGTTAVFGTAIQDPLVFLQPTLGVQLYIGGPTPSVSAGRADRNHNGGYVFTPGSPITEDLVRVMPIRGRKRVRATVRTRAGTTATVRFTGLVGYPTDPVIPGPLFDNTREFELVAPTAIPASDTDTFDISNPQANFLLFYALQTSAGMNDGIDFLLHAED